MPVDEAAIHTVSQDLSVTVVPEYKSRHVCVWQEAKLYWLLTEKAFPVILTPCHLSSSTKIPPVSKHAVPVDRPDRLTRACPSGKYPVFIGLLAYFTRWGDPREQFLKRLPQGHQDFRKSRGKIEDHLSSTSMEGKEFSIKSGLSASHIICLFR